MTTEEKQTTEVTIWLSEKRIRFSDGSEFIRSWRSEKPCSADLKIKRSAYMSMYRKRMRSRAADHNQELISLREKLMKIEENASNEKHMI